VPYQFTTQQLYPESPYNPYNTTPPYEPTTTISPIHQATTSVSPFYQATPAISPPSQALDPIFTPIPSAEQTQPQYKSGNNNNIKNIIPGYYNFDMNAPNFESGFKQVPRMSDFSPPSPARPIFPYTTAFNNHPPRRYWSNAGSSEVLGRGFWD